MANKITYYLSEQEEQWLEDVMVDEKFSGGRDKWIYGELRKAAITGINNVDEITTKGFIEFNLQSGVTKIKLPMFQNEELNFEDEDTPTHNGKMQILILGDKLYKALTESARLQNAISRKMGGKTFSNLDAYVDDIITSILRAKRLRIFNKELEDEESEIAPTKS